MKSGYEIWWTDHALSELDETIVYMESNWSENRMINFAAELDRVLGLISKSPEIFQIYHEKKGVRRAVIAKYHSLYYRVHEHSVEILSLFANRKDPKNKRM